MRMRSSRVRTWQALSQSNTRLMVSSSCAQVIWPRLGYGIADILVIAGTAPIPTFGVAAISSHQPRIAASIAATEMLGLAHRGADKAVDTVPRSPCNCQGLRHQLRQWLCGGNMRLST